MVESLDSLKSKRSFTCVAKLVKPCFTPILEFRTRQQEILFCLGCFSSYKAGVVTIYQRYSIWNYLLMNFQEKIFLLHHRSVLLCYYFQEIFSTTLLFGTPFLLISYTLIQAYCFIWNSRISVVVLKICNKW